MLSALAVSTLLSLGAPRAQDCDAKALASRLDNASAHSTAASFVALAGCDPESARQTLPAAFERMLYGDQAQAAVTAAIQLDSADEARTWIAQLFPDERVRLLKGLGERCAQDPAIASFLLDSPAALGERFWDDRWHRALIPCQDNGVKVLLTTTLQDRETQNHTTRFDSVLDVFIDHAGPDAIPWLKALMPAVREANQESVVAAFAAAAGAPGPVEPKVAREVVASLQELAPELSPAGVYRARKVLEAIGDQASADGLVCMRYWDRLHTPGFLMWGAVVVETAECKNGKVRIEAHHVLVQDRCKRWPDQILPAVQDSFGQEWSGMLAQRCKGTSSFEHLVPAEPFEDEAGYQAWRDAILRELEARPALSIELLDRGSADLP
jgi:hypothetical protein